MMGVCPPGMPTVPRICWQDWKNMVLMGMDLPLTAIRNQIASGVDVIVHLGRIRDKSRRVLEITEVVGCENGEIRLNPLYQFEELGENSEGKVVGRLRRKGELLHEGSLRQQDYHKVFQKQGRLHTAAGTDIRGSYIFAWFFYRSIWAVPLLFPLGILYFRRCVNRQCRKNRQELTMQFKECILSVANSLRSGYALENAFLESREDIRMLYGEHSAMYRNWN